MFIHDDNRRKLIEWIDDIPFRSAKVVIAKSDERIGHHYHNKKDEVFLLLEGKAKKVIIGDEEEYNISAPKRWYVPKGTYHSFELKKGSILLGVATEPFDPEDEIEPKE